MKNSNLKFRFWFTLFAVSVFAIVVFSSCEDEEELVIPGIILTDTPPEELFAENNYALTYRCWIDANSLFKVKDKGDGCLNFTDQYGRNYSEYCGTWKIFPCRKYWGLKNGIIYLSVSVDWYTVNPEIFYKIKDLVEKRGTIIGYMQQTSNTPWGLIPGIEGIE